MFIKIIILVKIIFLSSVQATPVIDKQSNQDQNSSALPFQKQINKQNSNTDKNKTDKSTKNQEKKVDYTILVKGKKQIASDKYTLSSSQIEMRGNSLPEVLNSEISLQFLWDPKQGSSLQIRGFDERNSLVIFGGIPVKEIFNGHFNLDVFRDILFEQVTFETGIPTLFYGPGTMGGIIKLNPLSGKVISRTTISMETGNYHNQKLNDLQISAKTRQQTGKWKWMLAVGYKQSNGYHLSSKFAPNEENIIFHEDGGQREGSKFSSLSLLAAASRRVGNSGQLFAFGAFINNPREIPPFESSNYTRYWKYVDYASFFGGVRYYWQNPENNRLFQNFSTNFYTHIHQDQINAYDNSQYETLTSDPLAWFVASSYNNKSFGSSTKLSWKLNPKNVIQLKTNYHFDLHSQREIPLPEAGENRSWNPWEKYIQHGGSGILAYKYQKKSWSASWENSLSFLQLLQQEINNTSYEVDKIPKTALESRIKLKVKFLEKINFNLKGGRKVRYPTIKELFANHVGGNPDLKPETAWMADLGLDSNGHFFPNHLWSLRFYYYDIKDMIQKYRDSFGNVGHALITGFETRSKWKLHTRIFKEKLKLFFVLGYRFLYTKDLENSRNLDYRSPHRFITSLAASFNKKVKGRFEAAYTSSQVAYWYNSVGGQWERDDLPGGFLLNSYIDYKFYQGNYFNSTLYFRINNLLDINYMTGSLEPKPGRTCHVGIKGIF
ncbi:MAG: TonB-dependent receptor plug domain-containing protein [Myxococcota bacterium]